MSIAYDITIGSRSLSSRDATGSELVEVEVRRGMGGAGGHCALRLGAAARGWPMPGDALGVSLDAGRGMQTVFTGEVRSVHGTAASSTVLGRDGMAGLAELELQRSYEEVSAGFIIKDLIAAVGARAGEIDEGPSFPRYVLHQSPRALEHAKRLGALVGAELHTDGEGRVHFRRPQSQPTRHVLRWGDDVLDLEVGQRAPLMDSLDVWGEGAAGTDGASREHWLTTDLTGVRGQAAPSGDPGASSVEAGRLGLRPRTVVDGAIRSVGVAEDVAGAVMQAHWLRPYAGSVLLGGLVDVEPGDWIELAELPPAVRPSVLESLTVLVRQLSHLLSPTQGLLTRLGF